MTNTKIAFKHVSILLIILLVSCSGKNESNYKKIDYVFSDGTQYFGEMQNGMPNGNGIAISVDNKIYSGRFINGKPNGFGVGINPGDAVFVGKYSNGIPKGRGLLAETDGTIYVGNLDGDYDLNGWGIITYLDGQAYVGQIKNNEPHGMGIDISEGEKYFIGEYVKGIEEGKGIIVYPVGDIEHAVYKNGIRIQ